MSQQSNYDPVPIPESTRDVAPRAVDDFELVPVAIRVVGTMRVRYIDGGRIAPLPYRLDDEC